MLLLRDFVPGMMVLFETLVESLRVMLGVLFGRALWKYAERDEIKEIISILLKSQKVLFGTL